jgi:tritrans,polycis-undecaprenyl-diphosphate synthase [geranylgeranyl-diphosphate specific]
LNTPTHIAIIPDGNRRFAKRLLEQPSKGHEWGIEKIKSVFEWCKELGIRIMTFYTLSLENIGSRPKEELDLLYALARKELEDVLGNDDNFVNKNRIRMNFFGNLEKLPEDLQGTIRKVARKTGGNSDFHLNMAIAYGGRQELIKASRSIALDIAQGRLSPEAVDELVLRHNLQTNGHPDPDLVLRTGGEKRISNFLLFQSAYSELAFVDTFWPELTRKEFFEEIRKFGERDRRFGK